MRKLRLNRLEQFGVDRLLNTSDSVLLSFNTIALVLDEDNPLFIDAKNRIDSLEKGEFIKLTTTATKYDDGSITTQFSPSSPHYIHPQVASEFFSKIESKKEHSSIVHLEIFVVVKRKPDSVSKTKRNRGIRDLAKVKKRLFDILDLIDEEEYAEQAYIGVLHDTVKDFNNAEDTDFDEVECVLEYQISRDMSEGSHY